MSQKPNVKKSWIWRNPTYAIMIPAIIGLHIGWFVLQKYYVPPPERHDHPIIRLYKKTTETAETAE